MAFGRTLADLRRLLRAEVGQSLNPAQGVNAQGQYDMVLDRVQKELWESYEWPHLTYFTSLPIYAGQQLYQYPASMPFDYIVKVFASGQSSGAATNWIPMIFGIHPFDYAQYPVPAMVIPPTTNPLIAPGEDPNYVPPSTGEPVPVPPPEGSPDTSNPGWTSPPAGPADPGGGDVPPTPGDTTPPTTGPPPGPGDPDWEPPPVPTPIPTTYVGQAYPPTKWANRPMVQQGYTFPIGMMELFPVPNRNGSMLFQGQAPLNPLLGDADLAVLDDVLITLFAAAEILASQNAEHAAMKLTKANQFLRRHFANLGGGKRTIRALGGTGSYPDALPRARPGIDYILPAG